MDFSERSFLFHSPIRLPGGGVSLCSSWSSSWVPGLGLEEVYRLIKLDHCPPGVFNFGREVYKCNSRFNFLRVTLEGQRIKGFRVSRGRKEMGWHEAPVLP